ncbi:hypothetical protein HQN84_20345 [Pedobacter steynii]|nr:hypothetical protein [Pedobacter steynii]NQX41212.1 hypothetical protein [Pedobacter steynii]
MLFSLSSCKGGRPDSKNNQDTIQKDSSIVQRDSTTKAQTRPQPVAETVHLPESFYKDIQLMATDIVRVKFLKVDTFKYNVKVYRTQVLKVYKGKLKTAQFLDYAGRSERNFGSNPTDTVIVFLYHHKKPLEHFEDKNLRYSVVEDNATVDNSKYIDSLLKKR